MACRIMFVIIWSSFSQYVEQLMKHCQENKERDSIFLLMLGKVLVLLLSVSETCVLVKWNTGIRDEILVIC